VLGVPRDCVGDKVSTEWVLIGVDGSLFTLYDYKATNVYDPSMVDPDSFRRSTELYPYHWHIGGREKPEAFLAWLRRRIAETA
jgi:hypothetical protein